MEALNYHPLSIPSPALASIGPLAPDAPETIGPYRLLAKLGAGGMGRVYLARSAQGRTVAVKVVRAEFADDPEFRRRFRREVAAARSVGSDHTAPVIDADAEAALPWLATSYVSGPSLATVVGRFGPLPEHTIRAVGAALAEALVAIHAGGLTVGYRGAHAPGRTPRRAGAGRPTARPTPSPHLRPPRRPPRRNAAGPWAGCPGGSSSPAARSPPPAARPGCSSTGTSPRPTPPAASPTSNLKPLWHYPATDFAWFLVPVPSAKTLVLLLNKGTVALDTDTGSARWTNPDFRSAYAVTEGSTLYLWNGKTADGFDLATGTDTWTLTSAVGAPVAASGDVLCLTMGKDGSRMTGWSISRKQAVWTRPNQPAVIAIAGGLVLTADKNEMQAVNCLDGTSKWTYITPPPLAREVFATDANGFYCTMESPSTLYAGNLDDGTPRWSAKTPGERDIGAVTAADGTVFAVSTFSRTRTSTPPP
ncbi:PQQ-binding-like beta-propeller repeat protein [Kitasatospora sp. NPDC101155]|uniref:outer membrane protein assembly factor BamB family protein n=1 Tax=Kitasatospora sp. NPDC101155 TaxID=3364097 RepID=UPI00381EC668